MKLIKEIEKAAESNTEAMPTLYSNIKACLVKMAVTNTMSRAEVTYVCAGLIRLYEGLSKKGDGDTEE